VAAVVAVTGAGVEKGVAAKKRGCIRMRKKTHVTHGVSWRIQALELDSSPHLHDVAGGQAPIHAGDLSRGIGMGEKLRAGRGHHGFVAAGVIAVFVGIEYLRNRPTPRLRLGQALLVVQGVHGERLTAFRACDQVIEVAIGIACPNLFDDHVLLRPGELCLNSNPRPLGRHQSILGCRTMTVRPPADIGMRLEDVDTPALIIELDAFEANLARMAEAAKTAGVRLRPHAKTHKCALIALRQIALGAVGVCCQKVSEAEALVQGGVRDVLISNEIVGRRKIAHLAALAREATLAVCVDDAGNIADLDAAVARAGVTLDVLVEVDVGAHRCGVAPGGPALELAKRIEAAKALRFAGLQVYQGSAQHIRDHGERRAAVEAAVEAAGKTVALLGEHGLACRSVTGAGTGTYRFEAASGLYNELQAGSYIFMDADYARNRGEGGEAFDEFQHSLFVYTSVMSTPAPGRAVVDAGLKASSVDSGLPTVHALPGITFTGASDEHGKLEFDARDITVSLGDKLKLIPGHCDPTVNLYDWYVCVRNGRVQALWPIVARGALL
jgi:3-hydroxy-D-aspartate aldolase